MKKQTVITAELKKKFYTMGRPHGPFQDWTYNPRLTPDENALCARAFRGFIGTVSQVRQKDRLKVEEIYARIYESTETKGSK